MNTFMKSILAATLALSFGASAELVSSDRYVENDSKAVLDTETGLEWLSLSETRLADVAGGSLSDKINSLASANEGWRVATYDEVEELFFNSFGTLNMTGIGVSNSDFITFLSHFETSSKFDSHYGLGLYYNDEGGILSSGTSTWVSGGVTIHGSILSYTGSDSKLRGSNTVYNSVYLVNSGNVTYSSLNDPYFNAIQNVPAPFFLGSIGLMALFASRKKREL